MTTATLLQYLEEWRCIQQSSISTKTNYEVYTIGDVIQVWEISNNFKKSIIFHLIA